MDIPIKQVAIVKDQFAETISLNTDWGFNFKVDIYHNSAVNFALEKFPNELITLLDLTEATPQIKILQNAKHP